MVNKLGRTNEASERFNTANQRFSKAAAGMISIPAAVGENPSHFPEAAPVSAPLLAPQPIPAGSSDHEAVRKLLKTWTDNLVVKASSEDNQLILNLPYLHPNRQPAHTAEGFELVLPPQSIGAVQGGLMRRNQQFREEIFPQGSALIADVSAWALWLASKKARMQQRWADAQKAADVPTPSIRIPGDARAAEAPKFGAAVAV